MGAPTPPSLPGAVCQQISEREVDAMTAERDSIERFTALYLKSQVPPTGKGLIV